MNGLADRFAFRSAGGESAGRRSLRRAGWLALAVAATTAAAVRAAPAEGPGLPPLTRTKHTSFSIPFRPPQPSPRDKDAAVERIVLQVSQDLGGTWLDAGEAAPTAGAITYRAGADGEYWFRLRAIDRQGRTRGGPGPDMRVLVDAAAPRLAARVWKGADGEIVCRYAAADDSIDLATMRFEYRGPGDPGWKTVAAEGILARQAPAHMVGEEIWWAGEKVDSLTVRIAVADAAGNQTVRQFSLEPSDPRVDQAALAREIGVPPLPGAGPDDPEDTQASLTVGAGAVSAGTIDTEASGEWPGRQAAAWANGRPPRDTGPSPVEDSAIRMTPRSVLVTRAVEKPVAAAEATADAAARPTPGGATAQPLEYRGRPLLLSRSRRFAWDYEAPTVPTDGRPLQAVLWSTADGGTTWSRAATAEVGRGTLEVQLPGSGLYGFRLELATTADGPGPSAGDAPETWVGIDEEPPQVEIVSIETTSDAEDTVVIRYAAHDALLAPRSARLFYSPHAAGPWATITTDAETPGAYTWRPDAAVPARVSIRVEVTDAAGNVGFAVSEEPVTVAPSRFTGKLGGLKPLPAAAR